MINKKMTLTLCVCVVAISLPSIVYADPKPGSDEFPIQYLGPELPDRWAPDGHLMYSPGVQNIQISRANRKYPPSFIPSSQRHLGWTYQHHIGIGCWKGKYYAVWDMTLKDEDIPPCHVVYSTSADGFTWSAPKDLFPYGQAFSLRFYFYHSTNGRMLAFGAGYFPTDDILEAKKEILIAREIKADHSFGDVYTLIKPGPGSPPFFENSKDEGFVAACREAVNNKPLLEQQDYGVLLGERRMKWHDAKNWPGGKVGGIGDFWVFGKSQCFYHREDGTLVSISKMGFVTQSKDEGQTWSRPVIPDGLVGGSGKLWAQKTPDGRYAMIYIPQKSARYPMAVTTSDDGIIFKDMRVIHGEISPQRYHGRAKGGGPQYLRGVAEWGGDAMSLEKDSIMVIYSLNKEDIWVSRVPVPILPENDSPVNDSFEDIAAGPRVPLWNTYSPVWAPVSIVSEQGISNKCLELADRDPAEYARAIRTFKPSNKVDVSFRLKASQADRGKLNIDLLGDLGTRPVRLVLNDKGRLQVVKDQLPGSVVTSAEVGQAGLVGTYFNNEGFDDPEETLDHLLNVDPLMSVDQDWGKSRGSTWSSRWKGFVEASYSGEVTFSAVAADGIRLKIAGKTVIDGLAPKTGRSGKVQMTKGKKMPIEIEFESSFGKARLQLSWQWKGKSSSIVPAEALSHDLNAMPERYNIFDFQQRYGDGYISPVDAAAYEAKVWNNFRIQADCSTGRYAVYMNGRKIVEDIVFAEPSKMVYAISFRTGDKDISTRGIVKFKDLPNTEEPLKQISYHIDDVKVSR